MKKRIGSFLLAMILLLSFTACHSKKNKPDTSDTETSQVLRPSDIGSSEWAYGLWEKSMNLAAKVSGKYIFLTGTIIEENDERKTETDLDLTLRSQEDKNDSNDELDVDSYTYTDHLVASVTKDHIESTYSIYYVDGVRYYADKDGKYCQTVDRTSALPELAYFQLPDLTEACFKEPIVATENGLISFSLPLSGDMLADQLLIADGAVANIMGGLQENIDYTIGETTVKLSFNEKEYLKGYDIFYTVTMNDIKNTKLSISLVMEFKTPGKSVTVTTPDFSGYTEMYSSVLNDKAYDAMPDILDQLFDKNGDRVENFKELYKQLCDKYSKTTVNSVVAWFEKQL